jgi:hypothetical protein
MAEQIDVWATVELMGHAQTAGRISRPSDWGGLLRVDVPEGDNYRTEFYGLQAVYSLKLVSEAIARAYAIPIHDQLSYNAPIITREQHESALRTAQARERQMVDRIRQLESRLIAVNALPAPDDSDEYMNDDPSDSYR